MSLKNRIREIQNLPTVRSGEDDITKLHPAYLWWKNLALESITDYESARKKLWSRTHGRVNLDSRAVEFQLFGAVTVELLTRYRNLLREEHVQAIWDDLEAVVDMLQDEIRDDEFDALFDQFTAYKREPAVLTKQVIFGSQYAVVTTQGAVSRDDLIQSYPGWLLSLMTFHRLQSLTNNRIPILAFFVHPDLPLSPAGWEKNFFSRPDEVRAWLLAHGKDKWLQMPVEWVWGLAVKGKLTLDDM